MFSDPKAQQALAVGLTFFLLTVGSAIFIWSVGTFID